MNLRAWWPTVVVICSNRSVSRIAAQVWLCAERPLSVAQSALSQHRTRLREAGIVDAEVLTLAHGLLRLVDRREKQQP